MKISHLLNSEFRCIHSPYRSENQPLFLCHEDKNPYNIYVIIFLSSSLQSATTGGLGKINWKNSAVAKWNRIHLHNGRARDRSPRFSMFCSTERAPFSLKSWKDAGENRVFASSIAARGTWRFTLAKIGMDFVFSHCIDMIWEQACMHYVHTVALK